MAKTIVSQTIFEELIKSKERKTEYGSIGFLYKNDILSAAETIEAIKAFLNPDGYELELTPKEKAIAMYKSLSAFSPNGLAFKDAMQWMDENFALGLNFHLID